MPLYEYACESCGHRFELIRKLSDPPLDQCPQCAGGPVQKLLSSPAIQFKGSGWYITDYAQKGKSGGELSAGSDAPAEKKPDSTKADTSTKPDTAATSTTSPTTAKD